MKNKRNVLIAFILICCLCLSIGYAAVTDILTINGTAGVLIDNPNNDDNPEDNPTPFEENFDANLGFSESKAASASEGAKMEDKTDASLYANLTDTVSFAISDMKKAGDTATITYTITNKNEYAATIAEFKVTNSNEKYTVAYVPSATTIPAGGSIDVVVTVTLTELDSLGASFQMQYKASAVLPTATN